MEEVYYGSNLNEICKYYNLIYSIKTNNYMLNVIFKNDDISFICEFDLTIYSFIECIDNSILSLLNFLNFK